MIGRLYTYDPLNMIGRERANRELWLVVTANETQRGDGLSLVSMNSAHPL